MVERNGCACCLCISLGGVVLAALRVGAMAGSPVSPQRPVLLASRHGSTWLTLLFASLRLAALASASRACRHKFRARSAPASSASSGGAPRTVPRGFISILANS